jgi:predicted dehydrogenase
MPAMCIRFWPQYHLLYQAVHDQRFGPLLDASFHRLGSAPPGWFRDGSQSGGAILDLHLHDTDFVHYLLGPPQAVFSQGYTGPSGLIDAISSSFIYQPSASAVPAPPHFIHLQATWTQHPAAPFTMSYRANFQHATLIFDSTRQPSLTIASAAGLESPDFSSDGYEQELAYFIDCIATGSRPDRADPLHVARSPCIIEAEARSVTSGRIEPVHFG